MKKKNKTNNKDKDIQDTSPVTMVSNGIASRYETTYKSIDDYIYEISRHNRYKSVYGVYGDVIIDDRSRLIDLYDMALEQDAHIRATISTLESQMLGDRYSVGKINDGGMYKIDHDETDKIQCSSFDVAIKGIMEAILYGYTVLEIFPILDKFNKKISHIKSIERRNVLPNQHSVITNIRDASSKKFDLLSDRYIDNYILIKTEDLGLFSTTTPLVLAKKFALSSYVNFTNTYGMPIIHGKTQDITQTSKRRLATAIAQAVNDRVIVTSKDDTIDVKSLSVSNSERIYIGLLEIVNRDISNVVLGSESMAGATQSYVGSTKAHQDIFRDRISVYRKFIENIMNEQVIPRLVKMGYLKDGLIFRYNKRVDMSIEEKLNVIKTIMPNYDIPEDYFLNEFGMSVTKKDFSNGGYGGTGGSSSDGEHRRMTDDEYFKRYGKERGSENRISIDIVNKLHKIYSKQND